MVLSSSLPIIPPTFPIEIAPEPVEPDIESIVIAEFYYSLTPLTLEGEEDEVTVTIPSFISNSYYADTFGSLIACFSCKSILSTLAITSSWV